MHHAHPSLPRTADDPGLAALLEQLSLGRTRRYPGEPVTHWEHAVQTAGLALQARASAFMITAALLHDIGHLDADISDTAPSQDGLDDLHEVRGSRRLALLFGPAVSEPVRLHVEAKRYLVSSSAGYGERLSDDSKRSLMLQGGPMTAAQRAVFEATPHAEDALRLRCWDDLAKDASVRALDIEVFLGALHQARRTA